MRRDIFTANFEPCVYFSLGFGSMEPRGLIFYQLFSKVFNEYFVSNPQQITALLSDKISFGLLASILQGVLTECFKNRSAALRWVVFYVFNFKEMFLC